MIDTTSLTSRILRLLGPTLLLNLVISAAQPDAEILLLLTAKPVGAALLSDIARYGTGVQVRKSPAGCGEQVWTQLLRGKGENEC